MTKKEISNYGIRKKGESVSNRRTMKTLLSIILLSVAITFGAFAQDLRCTISVTSRTSDGNVDRTIYEEMQKQLQDFVNGVKWCNYNIGPEERIECNLQFTIAERISDQRFKGKLNYALRRPVYNTSYTTTLISGIDEDIDITYMQGTALNFNENSFDDNLTSLVAFYINIFLGVYFDSFVPNGGSEYFSKAQNIVNNAQSAIEEGWRSYQRTQRNRYWIAENFLNPSYSQYHDFYYKFHLQGLDVMAENIEMGRAAAIQALENLRNVNRQKSSLYVTMLLLDAKRDEFIKMFTQANDNDKNKFIQYMSEIDPSNSSKYSAIKQ